MDVNNHEFCNFRAILDGVMKQINPKGIGLSSRKAQAVTPLEEEMLWAKGTFSSETSSGLLHAVYFYNCKVFGLSDEHANLEVSQFEFGRYVVGGYVRFTGRVTKHNQGGLKQCGKIQFKDIKQYAQPDNPRCFVGLPKTYLAAIPAEGPFYCRPLAGEDGMLRYSQQKVGIHTLQKMFKTICEEAGLDGRFTGHSTKVTLANTLFIAKGDELIMARTGDRSNAVRVYKHTSEEIN